jgi:Uma2 family endonuclease
MATSTEPIVLESGDRLTREEFHRRYLLRPDIHKAELVGGMVFVASPVRTSVHGAPHSLGVMWLQAYAGKSPGVQCATESTVYLDVDSEVQPDAMLFWLPPRGTRAHLDEDGYVVGPPDLVLEIAASSASYDLHAKKEAYRRAGVPEYIPWRTLDRAIDWFRLEDGDYIRVAPDADGILESAVFPGLRLDVAAMLAGDVAGVLAAIGARFEPS